MIRDEDAYSGVRVTMNAELATARPHFHVDVNVGDPITPPPRSCTFHACSAARSSCAATRSAMVYAEKIVTAISRGTVNTRWRDFADIYLLSRAPSRWPEPISLARCARSPVIAGSSRFLSPASSTATATSAKQRWAAWRRRQRLDDRLPRALTRSCARSSLLLTLLFLPRLQQAAPGTPRMAHGRSATTPRGRYDDPVMQRRFRIIVP